MSEFSCEACKTKGRVEKIRIVDVNSIMGDTIVIIPVVLCFNESCVLERGGSIRPNSVSLLPVAKDE